MGVKDEIEIEKYMGLVGELAGHCQGWPRVRVLAIRMGAGGGNFLQIRPYKPYG